MVSQQEKATPDEECAVKTIAVVTKPEEVEVSLTMTLSLEHWERLLGQLDTAWPASELSREIKDVVRQIRAKVYGSEDKAF